jgi:hypothetical protein
VDFEEIGEIPGSGTTYQAMSYQFMDERPLIGLGYYRIRQTDYDGSTDHSRIIAVSFDPFLDPARKDSDLLLYPNPAVGNSIRLVVNNRFNVQEMEILIMDVKGRIFMAESILLTDNIIDIDLTGSELAPGLYTIKLTDPSGTYMDKFIIQ